MTDDEEDLEPEQEDAGREDEEGGGLTAPGGDPQPDPPGEGGSSEKAPAPKRRARPVDPDHIGTFRWLEGVLGQALAVILQGDPVGSDRMDVGPAGRFLTIVDHLTRLLAVHNAGLAPKGTGTIASPAGVSKLQLAEATGGASITLYFAVDHPTQMTIDGGTDLYDSPMGRAIMDLVDLVERSDDDEGLIAKSHELGERIADRYFELVDFLVNEQLDVKWLPVDRQGAAMQASGAAEVKAVLNREIADEVESRFLTGRLYEANARTNGFQIETADGERVEGAYGEELTDLIRNAWDREVKATLRVIQHRRARSQRPFKIDHHLLDVVPLDGDAND